MTTVYRVLTVIVSVLAIVVCLIAYKLQLQGTAGDIVTFVVFMALLSAVGMWAILGIYDNPRSDKSVRR